MMPTTDTVRPGGPLRVLVAEDNRDAADTLALLLELWGHRPSVAYDGPASLAKAEAELPDVVLLDLSLPGLDGCEVARRMRATPALAAVFLLALTGRGGDDDRRRAYDAGVHGFCVKPVDPQELRHTLSRFARVTGGADGTKELGRVSNHV